MAYLKSVVVVSSFILLLVPCESYAYDRSVHEGITDAMVKIYEKIHGDTFTDADVSRIVSGSSAEDNDWRFLNHFYDPINYRGLTVLGISLGAPSEEWAQDTRGQASWRCIAYVPCSHNLGYDDKLFTSPTDYSWDRNIYEYVYGDKQRALEGLGHILHFIEDATVPAHVRNDQHGHIGVVGDPDPYETYTSQFTGADVPALHVVNVPAYSNLNAYLDHVATFTSTHFLSKDTIFQYFTLPNQKAMIQSSDFLKDPIDNYKVAWAKTTIDQYSEVKNTQFYIDDPQHLVLKENWEILSKTAVINGVGVIDLFFKKVEEERKTGAIRAKNVSAADENMKALASKGFGLVKALYGSSLSQADVDELLDEGSGSQSGSAVLATQRAPAPTQPSVNAAAPAPKAAPKLAAEVLPSETAPGKPPVPAVTPTPAKITDSQPPTPLQGISPGYGGGSPAAPPPEPDVPAVAPVELSIASPLDSVVFGTTSVTFSGTTNQADSVVAAYTSTTATSSIDIDGNWTVTLELPEGTTHVVFTAQKGSESSTAERDISIDLTPTDAAVIAVPACQRSLAMGFCLLASQAAEVEWDDVVGATAYALVTNGAIDSAVSATSAVATLAADATTTIAVVAYDAAGNAATSSSIFVGTVTAPLIINEIGWGGTKNSTADQWIEIKNTSVSDIDLSHVALAFSGGSTAQLSGTIAGGHYLVVQPHSFVMNLNPLVASFTLSTSPAEQIRLVWSALEGDQVLDTTPASDACAGWCAGEASAPRGTSVDRVPSPSFPLSMERIGSDGSLPSSWRSTDTYDSATWGSPGGANSAGAPMLGVGCGGSTYLTGTDTPFNPGSGSCTFYSRRIPQLNNGNANRFAAFFRGSVGSSTAIFGNGQPLFSVASNVPTNFSSLSPEVGEHFFFAIFEKRSGPSRDTEPEVFKLFFTSSALPDGLIRNAPHSNYLVMPFTYAP